MLGSPNATAPKPSLLRVSWTALSQASREKEPMEILLIVVGLIGLASFIWIVVVAFQTHILWGLACLFLPFATLVFAVLNWDRAAKPFFAHLASSVLAFALAWSYIGSYLNSLDAETMQLQAENVQGVQQAIQQRVRSGQMTEREAKEEMRLVVMAAMKGQSYQPPFMSEATEEADPKVGVDPANQIDPAAPDANITTAIPQADEQPAPAPKPRRIQTYVAKNPHSAAADIGKSVRVTTRNGLDRAGALVEVSAKGELIVEQRIHGGQVRFTVDSAIVDGYKVQEWVER